MNKQIIIQVISAFLISLINMIFLLQNVLILVVFDIIIVLISIPLSFFHKKFRFFYIFLASFISISFILAIVIDFSIHPLGMP